MVFETKLSLASNSSYLALVWIECQIRRSQVPWAFLVAQMVKNLPAMWEPWVQSLGWEDLMEEGMATHSSILAWRIPMDRGAWQATVHGASKSRTQLSN